MARMSAHVIFTGRVQGVFFRATTEDIARAMGIGGWVRNTPDGAVEALFVGDESDVRECIAQCEKGPPGSRVDDIVVEWANANYELRGFSIK